jgi:hypothetical protein
VVSYDYWTGWIRVDLVDLASRAAIPASPPLASVHNAHVVAAGDTP